MGLAWKRLVWRRRGEEERKKEGFGDAPQELGMSNALVIKPEDVFDQDNSFT